MLKEIVEKLPEKPGVYIFKRGNKVLYVGKAKNLKKRVKQYFQKNIGLWKEDMVSKADNLDYFLAGNEQEALILEDKLIKKYNPPYNCLLKGDNSYVYIRISDDDFPKIEFTRFKDKKGIYIGPKPWKRDLKNMMELLRRILKFRTCSDTKFKKASLCSDFTLGLCAGWCVYREKEKYNKIIQMIKDFFNGNVDSVKNMVLEKINQAVEKQNFEYAEVLKNIYFKIDKIVEKQTIELSEPINAYFIKIKKVKNIYFMIYVKFVNGKLVDIVKLKDDENKFIETMLKEKLIKKVKKLGENFFMGE